MGFKRNPFRYGAEFGPDDLVGRKDGIAHVVLFKFPFKSIPTGL